MKDTLTQLINSCPFEFPQAHEVDPYGHGLIAQGGDLDPATLVTAYAQGLFPWFNDDEAPIAWWSPDPRCVLDPVNYKPSKSLKKQVKNLNWVIKVNSDFQQVVKNCALPRKFDGVHTEETWITKDMQWAYGQLHTLGFAHSIEVWNSEQTELYGGLYGLKIGRVFFGESMFYKKTNASKIAFWYLNNLCKHTGVSLIDCQLPNDHLISLGANTVSRQEFLQRFAILIQQPLMATEMYPPTLPSNADSNKSNNSTATEVMPSWHSPSTTSVSFAVSKLLSHNFDYQPP